MAGKDAGRISRQIAFWDMTRVDRPMMCGWVRSAFPLQDFKPGLKEGLLDPDDLDPQQFVGYYEDLFTNNTAVDDDLFWTAESFYGIPWMEAIMGCPIHTSSDTIWAEPRLVDSERLEYLDLKPDDRWFGKLLDFTRFLVELSDGRFPISVALLRGPLDILAAVRGSARLFLDLYDGPEEVQKAAEICTDTWIEVARAQLDLIPRFHGGYCNRLRLWAPGEAVFLQEDASVSISPRFYRKIGLPCDQRIARNFEYPLFHLHSSGLHIVDDVLGIEELRGIEVDIDPSGPPAEELIPILRRVQKKKSLVVWGSDIEEDLLLRDALSPTGLCFLTQRSSVDEASHWVGRLKGKISDGM